MGKVFYKLYYHTVWATYGREPTITPEIEKILPSIFNVVAGKFNLFIHAVGTMHDHVHVVLTVPPGMAISDAVGKIKGGSSHFLNHQTSSDCHFSWQDGFGIRSISDWELPKIINYVNTQREHHRARKTFSEFERAHEDEQID